MSPQETMEGGTLERALNKYLTNVEKDLDPHKGCSAHWPIQDGIKLLLQCQLALLNERAQDRKERSETFWKLTGTAVGCASLAATIISLCFRK